MTARSVDELLASARRAIDRVEPHELRRLHAYGALVVDIRPERQRAEEGELGFGIVVERNVLEWRFDLRGAHALPEVEGYDQLIVIVCSEGYASSLAAASLRQLGFTRPADLAGGYRAWRADAPPPGRRAARTPGRQDAVPPRRRISQTLNKTVDSFRRAPRRGLLR
jgi:rhodanese-related sulfurtransferase